MREGFFDVKEMDLETKEKLEIMTSTELLDFSWESQTLNHSTLWKLEIASAKSTTWFRKGTYGTT